MLNLVLTFNKHSVSNQTDTHIISEKELVSVGKPSGNQYSGLRRKSLQIWFHLTWLIFIKNCICVRELEPTSAESALITLELSNLKDTVRWCP